MRVMLAEAIHLLIVTVAVVAATGIAALLLANSEEYSSLIVMVFMAGTVGGVANNYRRLYLLPTNASILDEPDTRKLLTIQLYISPWIGGIFAVAMYGIFASGALQGELFPQFQATDLEFTTAYAFADQLLPATNSDAAKAILWGFVAGFAEMFVPNFIDKLTSENAIAE